ncbi:notchless protein 1-like protein [Vairimorpha necatrix]|uniref:Notchless protein 1-like protein n=1 Tax=Vairimorpha necatrix TaxID=6039 RepID=A0AAX4JGG4_9MICR
MNLLLVEFEDQNGKPLSDKMQVPDNITLDQLKSLINTNLSLYINGEPILDTLLSTISSLNLNNEDIIKIRTNKEEPSTQAATFCSSSYSGHEGPVLCLKFDDILVTGGSDCTIRFWDLTTKTQKKILKKHNHWIQCLNISPCKKFVVSGSIDGDIKLWSSDGEFIRSFIGHRDSVVAINFFKDMIVSASRDKSVKVFDFNGKCIFSYAHTKPVTCLVNNSEDLVSAGRDGKMKIYKGHSDLREINGHGSPINCLDMNGSFMISGSDDGNIVVWKDFVVHKRVKHDREVISLSLSSNNIYFASGSFDKTVRLWSVETGKMISKYFHVDFVYKVKLCNDLIISSSRDKTVKMYRVSKKKVIRDFICDDEVYCFDYFNNQLVCGTKSNRVYFFN